MKTRLQSRFTRVDIAALLAFAAVWIYYIIVVRYSAPFADESLYVAITDRFVRGDRPLVDEWTMPQFYCLFLCLPYRIYIALRGSTTGVLLFMRYLFLAFNAFCYWFMYIRLRAYRWLDFIATLLFCMYVPFGVFVCNYYTIPVRLLLIVCLLLFSDKQKPVPLIAAGIVFACSVLYQPGFALLYFGFSVLVFARFLRQKKGKAFLDAYAFCIHARVWRFFSLGVVLCAVVFLVWLLARSGLGNILTSLPNLLLTDNDHDFFAEGSTWSVFFKKAAEAVRIYGLVCLIPAFAVVVLSIVDAGRRNRSRSCPMRKVLFCAACAVWILSCIQPFRNRDSAHLDSFFSMYAAPALWFGLVCYLLCERKNKRFLLFWAVGLSSSLCVDFLSNIALSVNCPVAYIADLVFITDLVRELRAERPMEKITRVSLARERKSAERLDFSVRWLYRLTCSCFAVWFVFTFFVENTFFPTHYMLGEPLFSYPFHCEDGPSCSLRYPETSRINYAEKLADIDAIKSRRPKTLYIFGIAPELYLYAELPCASCSCWWMGETYLDRDIRYWELHPERRPACIYAPFDGSYDSAGRQNRLAQIRDTFDPLCTYSIEEGQGGLILTVSQWKSDSGA